MRKNWQLYGGLFSAILVVSWAAPLIKLLQVPGPTIAFYRLFIAAAFLNLLFFRRAARLPRSFTPDQWLSLLAAGVALALHFGLWISALSYTSITSGVVLIATQPLFCMVLSYLLLGEKPSVSLVVGLGFALFGTVLVGYSDLLTSLQSLRGDVLALSGSLAGVVYFIIGRKLREQQALIPYVLPVFTIAAVSAGIFCAWRQWPFHLDRREDVLILVALALGPTILGHGLFNWSLRFLPATTVNLALLGEPVLASLLAFGLFAERHPLLLYLGGGFILIGIFVGLRQPPPPGSAVACETHDDRL